MKRIAQRAADPLHRFGWKISDPFHDLVARNSGQGLAVNNTVEFESALPSSSAVPGYKHLAGKFSMGLG